MKTNIGWYHSTRGRYFTDTKKVGLDFTGAMFSEDAGQSTLIHETTHAFLCNNTELGIFLQDAERVIPQIENLSANQKKEMMKTLFINQQATQEGFATFFQYGILKRRTTKHQLKQWHGKLPNNYKRWLKPFLFAFKLDENLRDKLTEHLIGLTMNTTIRKDAVEFDLLSGPQALKEYFSNDDNNPNKRLQAMLAQIEMNPDLLLGTSEEIANASNLEYFEPISKKDISDFIFYITSKTGNPIRIPEEEIGNPLSVDQVYEHVQNNTIVANLNINLAENGEFLYNSEDFLHYADSFEVVFVSERGTRSEDNISVVKPLFDDEPEISFIAQTYTGEKYLYMSSKENAVKMLNNQLSSSTLAIKLGDYDYSKDKIIWLEGSRPPDLVIFNHFWQLKKFYESVVNEISSVSIEYCNMAPNPASPIRMLITKISNNNPIFCVNSQLPGQSDEVIKVFEDYADEMGIEFITKYKQAVNSHLVFWTGWDPRVDWVETMADGTELVRRD